MEKLNIAEILKDCSKGTKLYSPLVGECTLEHIHGELKKILISTSDGTTLTFNNNGTYFQIGNSECLLFPSKDQRDWSKFQRPFKDGDILISGLEDNPFIFKRINGLGNAQCYCAISCFGQLILNNDNWTCIKGCRLATEEEIQKLFDAIKVNGYKWNFETKTLEKLPKFKIGDKIKKKGNNDYRLTTIESINNNYYVIKTPDWFDNRYITDKLYFSNQDNYELVPSKFDITTLKPFDKVLARDTYRQIWIADFFSHIVKEPLGGYRFACIGHYWHKCIPYEGNQHLLGTTNDCDEYYKNWE